MRGPHEVPAEAELIRERREATIPRLSHRAAAERAAKLGNTSFSAATWQKIEKGEYSGGADRITLMAMVLGITPDELDQRGRPDAARLLRAEIDKRASEEPLLREVDRESTSEAVMQLLLQGLEEIRQEPRLSAAQKAELERQLIRSQLAHLQGQLEQMRTTLEIAQGISRDNKK
ncbi:hypothetical protein ACQEVF_25030 [Nonomuraea polychroma]|uniref:hypothetical protein n=1 Tax=Nonomuraea polychroma TaxID=46176 RepID=UPI003D89CC61